MDTSYPATPYHMSPYGGQADQSGTASTNRQQSVMAYLIAQPNQSTASQAPTISSDPVVLMHPPPHSIQEEHHMPYYLSNHHHPINVIPQQPINTASSPAKAQFNSFDPMPAAAAFQSPRMQRFRQASDMHVFHQHQQLPGYTNRPATVPETEEDIAGGTLPLKAGGHGETASEGEWRLARIMLPYWMVVCMALLITMTALLGCVVHQTKPMADGVLGTMQPPHVAPHIVNQQPAPSAPQQSPVVHSAPQHPQPPLSVRPRAPIHAAPINQLP